TYPVKANFIDGEAVAGNEGMAEVVEIGGEVRSLKVGDRVLPVNQAFGTWRNLAVAGEHEFIKVDVEGVSPISAATVVVNPCSAFRMLSDFVDLKPGDCVVQNGANSAVGQAVIQIARSRGIKTVNVIRDRPNLAETVKELTDLGADLVLTEGELRLPATTKRVLSLCEGGSRPKLGLNCVGGSSATNVARLLGDAGVLVTYGGMSREPVQLPTSLLIFKDLRARGFWMTRWYRTNPVGARSAMMSELFGLMREGKFKEPYHEKISLWRGLNSAWSESPAELVDALAKVSGGRSRKQILVA
ncbi:hypothetical protein HK405_010017, partial [Cladochytrium tenue]